MRAHAMKDAGATLLSSSMRRRAGRYSSHGACIDRSFMNELHRQAPMRGHGISSSRRPAMQAGREGRNTNRDFTIDENMMICGWGDMISRA